MKFAEDYLLKAKQKKKKSSQKDTSASSLALTRRPAALKSSTNHALGISRSACAAPSSLRTYS